MSIPRERSFKAGLVFGFGVGFVAGAVFLSSFIVWSQSVLRQRAEARLASRARPSSAKEQQSQLPTPVRGILLDRTVQFETPDGEPADLRPFDGKVLVFNLWATWCKPCLEELPSLESAALQFESSQRVAFVAVSRDTRDDLRAYLAQHTPRIPVLRLPDGAGLGDWDEMLPVTIVVAPNGRVLALHRGARAWDSPEMIERLRSLITEASRLPHL